MPELKHDYQIKDKILYTLLELKSKNGSYVTAESFSNFHNLPTPRCALLLNEILKDNYCKIYKTSPHDANKPEKIPYQITAFGESFLVDKGGYRKQYIKDIYKLAFKITAAILIPAALIIVGIATCNRT